MPWAALLHLIMACFMYGENELLVSSVINPELVAGVDDSSGVQAVSQAYDTFLKETSSYDVFGLSPRTLPRVCVCAHVHANRSMLRRARCLLPLSSCGANKRVPLVSVRNPGHQARGCESAPAHSLACVCVQNVPGAPGDFGVQEYHRWVCTCVWLMNQCGHSPPPRCHAGTLLSCLVCHNKASRATKLAMQVGSRKAAGLRGSMPLTRGVAATPMLPGAGAPAHRVCVLCVYGYVVADVVVDAQSIARCLRMSQVT